MPSGPRILANNVQGTTTDNPLLVGATTINSAGLANLPVVSSAHAVLVLDPLRVNGAPEIVVVTAHTASATSATITRGAYGTTARQHASGTVWVHAPTIDDVVRILTSATRPSDPYRGQLIFETDTNSFVARDTSDAWQTAVALGAWVSWTPTLTSLTLGSGTMVAKYVRTGRTIDFRFVFRYGAGSAVGTNPRFSLPVAMHADYTTNADWASFGDVHFQDATASSKRGQLWVTDSTTARLIAFSSESAVEVTATVPFTWASGDAIWAYGTYEAAS